MSDMAAPKKPDMVGKITDKGIDKLTAPKEGDGAIKGGAKELGSSVAKGAISGVKKGGVKGAAVGAASGVAKSKTGRRLWAASFIMSALPFILLVVMVAGAASAMGGDEGGVQANGQQAAGLTETDEGPKEGDDSAGGGTVDGAQVVGLSKDGAALVEASKSTGIPWFMLAAIKNSNTPLMPPTPELASGAPDGDGTTHLGAVLDDDGNIITPFKPKTGWDPGEGCDPWATKVGQYLSDHFAGHDGGADSIYCARPGDSDSDHNSGNALDYMTIPHDEKAIGDKTAAFLMKNASALSIKYLIWEQKIWNPSSDPYGVWRDMESRGNLSADHFDHIHISFQHPGADGDLTAGTPGTYDFSQPPAEITEADVAAAFGGEGSGGQVPGYEGSRSVEQMANDNPFKIKEDAEGWEPDDIEENEMLYESAKYVGQHLSNTLKKDKRYQGNPDIGTGMLMEDGAPKDSLSEERRKEIEDIWKDALKTLPLEGADADAWADQVITTAMSYRLGLESQCGVTNPSPPDPTTVDGDADPNDPNSSDGDTDPSANPSASPMATEPSAEPSASPSETPSSDQPGLPSAPAVELPFRVEPAYTAAGGYTAAMQGFNVEEKHLKNVAMVWQAAREIFPDEAQQQRAMLIATITMMVEDHLQNPASPAVPGSEGYPHDRVQSPDHDSAGVFQQRAGLGEYGDVAHIMNPYLAAYTFFGVQKGTNNPWRGLTQYNARTGGDWMIDDPGKIAQSIQGSAHPDRYATWVRDAQKVILAATGIVVDVNNPGGCIAAMDGMVGGGAAMGVLPASGNIVSPIAPQDAGKVRMSAKYGHYPSGGKHFGVDLAGGAWTIQSICDGTVKKIDIKPRYANSNAYKVSGSTNYIWIDCGNNVLMGYAHFYARELNGSLKEGMQIGAGTPLFPQGNQGNSSGGHLHLQISTSGSTRYNRESTVDPAQYLSQFGIALPKPNY